MPTYPCILFTALVIIQLIQSYKLTDSSSGLGCSNNILIATLLDANATVLDKVLVRIYGSQISSRLQEDIYINCHLGTLRRVPKIRGIFDGGRFEEFLPSRTMNREEFSGKYREMIKMIADVHKIEMPLSREPWLKRQLTDQITRVRVDPEKWRREVEWFVSTLEVLERDMRVTFCHNDFNMNNLLIPTTSSSPSPTSPTSLTPTLIDYEYSGYNHCLYDLANYCCEMQYDWSHDKPPFFLFKYQWFPDDTKMLDMIRHYKTLVKDPVVHTSDQVYLTQLKFLTLGSELTWTLWALSYKGFSLDMEPYLEVKRESYFTKKKEFLGDIEKLVRSYEYDN